MISPVSKFFSGSREGQCLINLSDMLGFRMYPTYDGSDLIRFEYYKSVVIVNPNDLAQHKPISILLSGEPHVLLMKKRNGLQIILTKNGVCF